VVGGEEGGGDMSELTMPVDTADQVVCIMAPGQTDDHSSPDHTSRRADIEWNSLGPQGTLLMPPSGSTGSVFVLRGLIGLAKAVFKSRLSYL